MKTNIHTSRFIAAVIFSHPLNFSTQEFPGMYSPEQLTTFINKIAKAKSDRKLHLITKTFGRKPHARVSIHLDAATLLQSIALLGINLNKVQTIDQATFEAYADIYQKSIIKPDSIKEQSVIETSLIPFANSVAGRADYSHKLHNPQLDFLASSFILYWEDMCHNDMCSLTSNHENVELFHQTVSELDAIYKILHLCNDAIHDPRELQNFKKQMLEISDLGVAILKTAENLAQAQEAHQSRIESVVEYFQS